MATRQKRAQQTSCHGKSWNAGMMILCPGFSIATLRDEIALGEFSYRIAAQSQETRTDLTLTGSFLCAAGDRGTKIPTNG
jgi:hypothetical protein